MRFVNTIKLVPECGESICGDCCEEITIMTNDPGKYTCKACKGVHSLPESGLPDCKALLRILRQKNLEKPLSDQANSLKDKVDVIQNRLQDLKSFDSLDYINLQCDSLELEVREAANSAYQHISEIEEHLLKEINDYRQECLNSLHSYSSKQSLGVLSSEADAFIQRWTDYFSRLDVLASEREIGLAFSQANSLNTKIQSMEEKLRAETLQYKSLRFKLNESFFQEKTCIGQIVFTRCHTNKAKDNPQHTRNYKIDINKV